MFEIARRAAVVARSVLILGLLLLIGDEFGHCQEKPARGAILSPRDNSEVNADESFAVTAKVTSVPRKHQVWACVEIEGLALYWPKEALSPTEVGGDEWTGYAIEGGPAGKTFRITLLLVPPSGVATIEQWLQTGQEKNDFPGLKLKDLEAERLASVRLKLK